MPLRISRTNTLQQRRFPLALVVIRRNVAGGNRCRLCTPPAEGIRFTILAPSQAQLARAIPYRRAARYRHEVGGSQIPPVLIAVSSRGNPNRDYIDIFFTMAHLEDMG